MHRYGFALPLFLAVFPFLPGCLIVPYGYPVVGQTRPIFLDEHGPEISAFRVEIDEELRHTIERFDRKVWARLSPLETYHQRFVSGQTRCGLNWGAYACLLGLDPFLDQEKHSLRVRLYRPGYQTVEILPWDLKPVTWKEAATLEEQEEAIAKLLEFEAMPDDERAMQHRRVLLFAAQEYERLGRMPCDDDTRQRLDSKAQKLRDCASGSDCRTLIAPWRHAVDPGHQVP